MGLKGLSRRYFIILFSTLLFASCYGKYLNKEDFEEAFADSDEDDDDDCRRRPKWACDDDDDWGLSTGAIVGIVFGVLFIFFGIPICLCFCCAWCCFAGRRKTHTQTAPIVVAAPMPQYQQPPPPQSTTIIYNPPANPNVAPSAPYPTQVYGNYGSYANTNTANNEANILNAEPPPPYYAATATVPPQERSSQDLGWKVNLS